jgi:hypothetical protein
MMFKHSNKNFNNMKRNLLTLFAAIFAAFSLNAQFARVQAIHNAADPALATVDVYLDTILLVPNFNFQQATPYIDAPAGINFDISLTAPGAGDTVGAIFKKSFTPDIRHHQHPGSQWRSRSSGMQRHLTSESIRRAGGSHKSRRRRNFCKSHPRGYRRSGGGCI